MRVILFTMMFFVCSCSKKSDDQIVNQISNQPVQIVPLKAGNVWTYRLSDYDSLGTVDSASSFNFDIEILRDTTIQNEKWFILKDDPTVRTNRTDGYYVWNISIDSMVPTLMAKYPAQVGDKFATYSVASTNVQVTTLIGTFTCFLYVSPSSTDGSRFEEYYSPGIGWIRRDYYTRFSGGILFMRTRWQLTGYTLK